MKTFLHKILSFTLAFVVLFSTMSFTVDMHFCGDEMIDFSVFHKAKTCGMEKSQITTPCKNGDLTQKSCCSDKQLIIEGQNQLKKDFNNFNLEQQQFITAFVYSYINLFESVNTNKQIYNTFKLPFVKQDLFVLHQTFLI